MDVPWLDDATLIREWSYGDEIVLDNVPLRVERGYGYQLTNTYGRRSIQGEPGPGDHPHNSEHIQRSWTGGLLVRDLQETADTTKGWDGDAWLQTRGALGAGLKVFKLTLPPGAPAGPCYPLDRMGDDAYWAVGWENGWILRMNEETHSLEQIDNTVHLFEGLVTNVGVTFRVHSGTDNEPETWLYIPTTRGYTRMKDGPFTTIDDPAGDTWPTVGFALNQNKIYRLTAEGEVFFATEHDDIWNWVGTIPDGSEPREIYRTYDDDGNRTIGIATSSGLWLLDHDNSITWDTDLTFPENAYQGYGATNWRGDDFISVGVGIHRKTGTLVVPAGLDDDDGLPAPFAGGLIVHLQPSYNLLVAALASDPPPEVRSYEQPPIPQIVATKYQHLRGLPDPIAQAGLRYLSQPDIYLPDERFGAIYAWNGLGWQRMHKWNRAPTRIRVTMIRNTTRFDREQHLLFGDVDGGAWTIHLPSTYYNPLESPNLPLRRESYYEEARIDWNMPDTPKVAKQLNVKPNHLYHQPVVDGPVYHNKIEVVCCWRDLNGIDHRSDDADVLAGPGPYPFSDGDVPQPYLLLEADAPELNSRRSAPIGWERYRNTGVLLPTGLPHEAIWMLWRWAGDPDNELTNAVIEWRSIISRKWMRPARLFTFEVNLQAAHKDMDPQTAAKFLDDIALKHQGVPLVVGDEFLIVDVTTNNGGGEAGLSSMGRRTISCLDFTDYTYERPIGFPNGSS